MKLEEKNVWKIVYKYKNIEMKEGFHVRAWLQNISPSFNHV